MIGKTNAITGGSKKENVIISLKTNQASQEDILGATVYVTTSEGTTEYTWKGEVIIIKLSPGEYTISCSAVDKYKTPDAVSYTAIGGTTRAVTLEYQTQLLRVNVVVEGDVMPVGYEVHIENNPYYYTLAEPTGTFKIPYGTTCMIYQSQVNGYTTSPMREFTADSPDREETMVYFQIMKPTSGVWIHTMDGLYVEPDSYYANIDGPANGVAVFTDAHSFIIALQDVEEASVSDAVLSTSPTNDIAGVTKASTEDAAMQDYLGESNTAAIINALGEDSPVATYCNNYIFPNGQKGYLGAAGEWNIIMNNSTAIQNALDKVGTILEEFYWSSTQKDRMYWWYVSLDANQLYDDRADMTPSYVRPFTSTPD